MVEEHPEFLGRMASSETETAGRIVLFVHLGFNGSRP
jgi:hypothetical protein